MKSLFIRFGILVLLCTVISAWYAIPDRFFVEQKNTSITVAKKTQIQNTVKEDKPDENVKEITQDKTEEKNIVKDLVKQSVPFTSQAPHAQWDDVRYQDACEEASMLMVDAWIRGESSISKNDAEEGMEKIFAFEENRFQGSIDTSLSDTRLIFQEMYNHPVEFYEDVTMENIYDFLAQDAVIIVPTNGKKLDNPNFANGGPDRHMLVIIGYDRKNKEFITNDPGTRLGRGYKYKDSTLYNAIRDYATGKKLEIDGAKKNIIVIKKQ